ncbi:type II secretion system F family protein [Novilysobacter spongiicola]|uniref:Tight adherence protein B n=1 Tax=Lysobacter spongiicola DSM 21749 TaxID=1122188 RepID=A0A1T4PZ64_9GAMM|nr:type II secretion system F family protein [Lysobacter spongiicola]MDX1548938.1 type II secretion system F family protein [Lysobacter spongiicola]SJZ96636.1 tight adherence protein B [Lysobacter spongiicola DSM 21749]
MNVWLIGVLVFLGVAAAGVVAVQAGERFMHRYQESFVNQARINLADMFMFMDTGSLFAINMAVLVLVPLILWIGTGNLLLPVATLLLLAILPRKIYVWMRQRRIDRIQEQLPDGLLMLAGSMKAGVGFGPAMEAMVADGMPPLAQELALVLREQRMGVKTEEALDHFAERVPVQDVKLFVSAVQISREVGGNLAESLTILAETLRRRLIMEGKVKALTSQGRLQGIVMAMLPVAMVAFLAFAYPETMRPMFHTPIGWSVIGICAVMEYLGYRMCRKIMTIDI